MALRSCVVRRWSGCRSLSIALIFAVSVTVPGYAQNTGSDGIETGLVEPQENAVLADPVQDSSTLVVNTNDDKNDGFCTVAHCSLREAINAANRVRGANVISFNIPGRGVQTIKPQKALPNVTDTVTIDGGSQPGFKGKPIIELSGVQAGDTSGLRLTAANCIVRGLIINSFGINGISIFGTRANGCKVQGCYVGTDATGNAARPNLSSGILILETKNNLIGGTTAAERNVISGNARSGVAVVGPETGILSTKTVIQGNYIGVNVSGTQAIPNRIGIYVENASDNVIGGTAAAERNVISGNARIGVAVFGPLKGSVSTKTVIRGNYIGVNVSGTQEIPNDYGIYVENASDNVVGGAQSGAGNVISGNASIGIILIGLEGDSRSNRIQGNLIGTDKSGLRGIGNPTGLHVQDSTNNLIGGTAPGERNVISTSSDAVLILADSGRADGNRVQGNFIGTDRTGKQGIGNFFGVTIGGGSRNLIGGTQSGARNLISGSLVGVRIVGTLNSSFGISNSVQGNYIGVGLDGKPIENFTGIAVQDAQKTLIGGTAKGAGNVISGNGDGILLSGTGGTTMAGSEYTIQGNTIGLDPTGTVAVGNFNGIRVGGGVGESIIGGNEPNAGNVISGNRGNGIVLDGASGILLLGNKIGTDRTGKIGVGNKGNGVACLNSTAIGIGVINPAGGGGTNSGNVISANEGNGVFILFSNEVLLQGNIIGTDVTGNFPLGNGLSGISLESSNQVIVGGLSGQEGNLVVDNGGVGVLDSFSTTNAILNNVIGFNVSGGVSIEYAGDDFVVQNKIFNNGSDGVKIAESFRIAIVGNSIYDNGGAGVSVRGQFANGNSIRLNSIFDNRLIGIDLKASGDTRQNHFITPNDRGDRDTGPNQLQNYPMLVEASTSQKTLIKGTLNSLPNTTYNLEFFSGGRPRGAIAQANEYLGQMEVKTNSAGSVSFTFNPPVALRGKFITATATNKTTDDTSEFSLPLAARFDSSRPTVSILKLSGLNLGSRAYRY